MKKNLLLICLVTLLFFSRLASAQVNEYSLVPVDLEIGPGDSTVQVDIYINTVDTIGAFLVALFAEGTSNPVLDTILTGGLADFNPPAFASPSLLVSFPTKLVNPYGPPSDPLIFFAHAFVSHLPPSNGLFCRMFYKVSGPGTLTFRTAVHSTAGATGMNTAYGPAPINWPSDGEVGSFNVTGPVNEYYLIPIDLDISPCDSTVQVNINLKTVELIYGFFVPLFAEGTCNPVLDTILTGGMNDANPPAFYPPSLVAGSAQRIVNQYGPPIDPMWFFSYHQEVDNDSGLWCRMFYRVSEPGTFTFRTARTSNGDTLCMFNGLGTRLINWPVAGEIGSFNITWHDISRGNVNCDEQIGVADVIYIVSYLFRGGPSPHPLENGDLNCDSKVTVADVLYLVNYLFKGGPPPPC